MITVLIGLAGDVLIAFLTGMLIGAGLCGVGCVGAAAWLAAREAAKERA
jgi:hypothetical protein